MSLRGLRRLLIPVVLLLLTASAFAAPAKKPAPAPEASPSPTGLQDLPELKALKYRLVGPAWGGRVSRVAGVPGDPLTYYAATAAGGVWKSADGGLSWKPIFDDQPISSIGSIAVAPSDPNVVYVGSGEANIRGNVAAGNGIYKSTDANSPSPAAPSSEPPEGLPPGPYGKVGVAVAPSDGRRVYALIEAEKGGLFRSDDGGENWKLVNRGHYLTQRAWYYMTLTIDP